MTRYKIIELKRGWYDQNEMDHLIGITGTLKEGFFKGKDDGFVDVKFIPDKEYEYLKSTLPESFVKNMYILLFWSKIKKIDDYPFIIED